MKISIAFTCLSFVLGFAVDSLAQFTPVTAKIRVTTYTMQSDGSSLAKVVQKGSYYRSFRGDVMITQYDVDENGRKNQPGRSSFTEASSGKTYSISHGGRDARVKHTRQLPLLPNTTQPASRYIANSTARVINGVSCLGMKVLSTDGTNTTTIGTNWHSVALDLTVRTEIDKGGGNRRVRELYDIQFREPASSSFGVPRGYLLD